MTVPLCYYGSPDPLPARRELRAGPLTAIYEAGDLRYVKVGGVEVCRRWYAAVRDHNWGTVPGVISDEVIEPLADGFRVTYTSTHRQGDIHFVWRATIAATFTPAKEGVTSFPTACVNFEFDGEAKSTFLRNRIGQCVLHPIRETAGKPVTVHPNPDPGGPPYLFTHFPKDISPTNPFAAFHQLDIALTSETSVSWWFFGDLFETEDQRNWIDASFKTFCTPLREPFPVEARAGGRVSQRVALIVLIGPDLATASDDRPNEILIARNTDKRPRLPHIGLSRASHGDPLTERELGLLRLLRPIHLREELDLTSPEYADRLARAAADASAIGAQLELAVTVSDAVEEETRRLGEAFRLVKPPLAQVLVFHHRSWCTPEFVVKPLRKILSEYDPGVPLCVGTTANFAELNRGDPPIWLADALCYSIQPQEHAFDNASLIECCPTIADTVRTTRRFCEVYPSVVSPITLRKRVNPYATGPARPPPPDELPPTVDPRQMSLFGAAWTLGALKYLAESRVPSATFYETVGWLGVMESARGCPLPQLFASQPGMVFPLFHVLADATELGRAAVFPCESADPLRFDALALRVGAKPRLLLANMTAEPQTVTIDGWFERDVRVRTLDETTFDYATSDPVAFRTDRGPPISINGGRLTLSLKPYAYVRLDG